MGVSGQRGAFTEFAVREMAKHVDRPIIFPLSNPVSCSEANPQDLLNWTEGRALIGTGSPFPPVSYGGKNVPIDQTNNSYIFPGLALGIVAAKARRVTDTMIMAAAKELARLVPTQTNKQGSLLPSLSDSRQLSRSIAQAVGRQAIRDGEAQVADEDSLERELQANIWDPVYVPYQRIY
jgi:malate dehydrogenase (oxaloacetate-decarboxylating)